MWPALPVAPSLVGSSVLALAGAGLARVLLPDLAKTGAARASAALLAAAIVGAHLAWTSSCFEVSYWGAAIASVILCLLPFALVSVPLSALARFGAKAALAPVAPVGVTRRAVLCAATAAAPAVAIATGVTGFTTADAPPRVPRVRFAWPDLPPELAGLSILHLSDLHLGVERHVEDLEALFDTLGGRRPDLVVLTGDVAEDLRELGPALDAAVRFGPRLGVFASLGNHEYLRGVAAARAIYAQRRDVRLLVGEGALVSVRGAKLWIAGADDPVYVDADPKPFLRRSIESALAGAPKDAFRVLMCHRPEGFVPATEAGVELTLAGHTHGGQIGFNGRSAFEPIWRDHYLWGRYARGRSRLYTTSGFGHWFPFRLLCPTEAPIVELARSAQ